ncbi:MAG TPA: cytochrome c oxidase subunit II [Solirubrobacteraceae bacterium]|jgi:cytochrome c oxidase subunit 2|nr:cytochrome c oxidase subunit II [Solirubrobacteraceae bacterium]
MSEPNHARRFALIWGIATVVATPLVILLVGPILPPGKATEQAGGQVTDNTVLIGMATPVLLLVVLYLIYSSIYFRQPKDGPVLEGPAIRGDARVQTTWLIVTTALVLSLAAYGTLRLLSDDGAGSGSGPTPLTVPKGPKLPVQVIGQQWAFTYRYPTYGGVEVPHLVIPAHKMIELHVTSLDVIHSFWSRQLGVKADANPQVDNIAFVEANHPGAFEVRCAELCGLWHGEMFDHGRVVSESEFSTWIQQAQVTYAAATKALPPYSTSYLPEPTRRGG